MRIISGKFKGRKLKSFKESNIRPTSDRLRESIFNILGNKVEDRQVLDLFAGTGAMGIEALSRGARQAVFIDDHVGALSILRYHVERFGLKERTRIIKWNIHKNLYCLKKTSHKFDLIFLDPPYGKNLILPALTHLMASGAVVKGAIFAVEHASSDPLSEDLPSLKTTDRRRYGKTLVSFLKYVI